ncbi:bacteriohopanetetrol glucosamine biosynthesis glycosyltransferase HpnI [Cupriavidus taiwanensis]|uniref:Putative glycosyl transferase, family 2, similar to mouse Ceramide glucosyltransferase n=1 Tax=Cupriavidus taiwanensis TaxID=164546 RepID=A0A375IQ73_9BURK|nr:bacteriohopanetetrol glucosamine biosynthesis glycosyltransferase HpnI [Cupriavidus taiwanensis]SOZ28363.1 Putative glycosyl transferase, family 2, similar to mouse Ceramide glucosyltransferase [Cupriavidus taiwanensis]SPA33132.1 Putative glycosyl transferase, family 2, similar to mouse Ceramide glucosyltransferase [Cupriavidus taiwanensis]SPK76764.1 putative glycosyl transferase, family 2, similar to mouse Ceramide glucosyltransferase [Cupriavidus taiwanensis]
MAAGLAAILPGAALVCVTAGYALAATWLSRRKPAHGGAVASTPVSVLKPLCGAEPRLYANLATFCRQRHPCFQLVFGVRAADDPAIAVVERLGRDFPACDIALVIDPRVHGSNLKVSNLINLSGAARHDALVIADSDVAVAPDHLARVTAPLAQAGVGVVTCLYRGHAIGGFWSRLGAQFVDDWFAPAVRIAHAGGSRRFAFGATIALRRDALAAIGGFGALRDRLADDYWLGELTRRLGLRTVLSEVVVTTDITEDRFTPLWRHELRWMRTIASLNAMGYAFSFITFTWPMLALGVWLAPLPLVIAAALVGVMARSVLAGSVAAALRAPLRDGLLLACWALALAGKRVWWREQVLSVGEAQHSGRAPALSPTPLPQAGEGRKQPKPAPDTQAFTGIHTKRPL